MKIQSDPVVKGLIKVLSSYAHDDQSFWFSGAMLYHHLDPTQRHRLALIVKGYNFTKGVMEE